ncbi:MAG: pyridoxal phosphate-dependent aminotransferase [Gammaproteobacteria bacterium]
MADQTLPSGNTLKAVTAPIIPVVANWIHNSPGTLSLGQGMVSYPPPASALEAIADFGTKPDHHHYGPASGYPQLVEMLEKKLLAENAIDVADGYRIMVTAGSNMAFLNVLLAISDPGDEIILPLPYYFNQEMAVRMLSRAPVFVRTDDNFQLNIRSLRTAITPNTRAIVTVSPNNPSGAVYPKEAIHAVNELCRERGLYHISDEAYEYFTYDEARHFSPASIKGAHKHTISLYSLSKAYGFASWRIGYVVFPEKIQTALLKVQDTNLICPPLITQFAAIGALSVGSSYCKKQLIALASVRKQVLNHLQTLQDSGLGTITATEGAFYLLLKLNTPADDLEIVKALIDDFKIATIPGSAFGLQDKCYLRLSYGMLDRSYVDIAMRRLINGIQTLLI